ncbi:hypothetical protein FK425_RS09130 [Enterococcus hirae]|uniref:YopX family protein n=1 Tax=Enterococcus sp. (strain 3G1_DIV0629) TaxID=1834176 RepID=UPI000A33B97C|nr:YopX family protein [Enterococcus sp. 3G1_DIV0629]OTO28289.1 hypothetical protein A5816_000555 [Enterococcus sp. 3G1_DIV0629]
MIPKFRAWHIIDKKMISWKRLLNGHNLRNVFMRPEMCNLKLMQSTGLKDKNGVEIFEGDLVSISVQNGFDYLDNKVCVVKNSIGHSGLVCATVDEDLEYRIFNTELFEEYTYEVIGNIYDNPELLEEQR